MTDLMLIYKKKNNEVKVMDMHVEDITINLKKKFDDELNFLNKIIKTITVETQKINIIMIHGKN